jgi:hypothetical protein
MNAVQKVIAENGVFPSNRILRRMRAGIAPMTIQIVFGERRARAGQFKQFARGRDGDLGAQYFGFRHGTLRFREGLRRRIGHGAIGGEPAFFQQGLGRVQSQNEVAHGLDRIGMLPGGTKV